MKLNRTVWQQFYKRLNQLLNIFSVLALIVVVAVYARNFSSSLEWKDKKIRQTYSLIRSDGTKIIWPPSQNHIVVFWADWCGPCSIELKRLNSMIEEGTLQADQVIAIHIEKLADLKKIRSDRGYKFELYESEDQKIFGEFEVRSTPTTLWISSNQSVRWRSVGLTPLLSIYVKIFL